MKQTDQQLKLKPVYGQGGKKADKGSFKNLVFNKHLMAMIGIQMMFRIGNVYFSSFYPIHLTETGGTSSNVGLAAHRNKAPEIRKNIFR